MLYQASPENLAEAQNGVPVGNDRCYETPRTGSSTQMDGLTNLGFLLLFSHPVTHLLPQETSPTSTFLTAVWTLLRAFIQ